MEKKNKKKPSCPIGLGGILIRIALILMVLIMLSIHLTGGLYAKYKSAASSSDSARVIKFQQLNVVETGDFTGDHQFVFIPGVPLRKSIQVSFGGSEAATIVFVKVSAPGWTVSNKTDYVDSQAQLSWSVANGWQHLESKGNTHVYYIELDPNEALGATEFIKNSTVNVSEDGTVDQYLQYPPTAFTVTAYAMQANGVSSVAEAWSMLST